MCNILEQAWLTSGELGIVENTRLIVLLVAIVVAAIAFAAAPLLHAALLLWD